MYRYNPACGLEPLPGLPLEASDADFEAAVAEYEARTEGKGSVVASGLYEHVRDEKQRGNAAASAEDAGNG